MVVEWLGEDFALGILAVSAVHNILDCLFCSIIHRQVSGGWEELCSEEERIKCKYFVASFA